jgi:hypothetical protein
MGILLYPFFVVLFWYKDGLISLLFFLKSLDDYLIRLFSLQGLFSTFFKPLKNEYRKNLVLFSVLFGIAVKLTLIVASLAIIGVFLLVELGIIVFYLVFPVIQFIFFLT